MIEVSIGYGGYYIVIEESIGYGGYYIVIEESTGMLAIL